MKLQTLAVYNYLTLKYVLPEEDEIGYPPLECGHVGPPQ